MDDNKTFTATCNRDWLRDPTREFDPAEEFLDEPSCSLAIMALILYNINFGYVCAFLLLLLAIISIFGGIKEHYRWFILNQVLYDSMFSYYFICSNNVEKLYAFPKINNSCFYWKNEIFHIWFDHLQYNLYSSLMLLSLSRVLCLYYKNFYKKLTSNSRIFITIFVYNFVVVVTNVPSIAVHFYYETLPGSFDERWENTILLMLAKIEFIAVYSKSPFCLCISIISTVMIILKVSRRFKYQLINHKTELISSIRIAAVITFQTLLYTSMFCIDGFRCIDILLIKLFGISSLYSNGSILPPWLEFNSNISDITIKNTFFQIRIFFESLIVIFFMSGYREAIIRFFYFVYFCLRNLFCKLNNVSSVTVI